MDLYQLHSPTLVVSSIVIIRILFVYELKNSWYIYMIHHDASIFYRIHLFLHVIVQNFLLEQRPDRYMGSCSTPRLFARWFHRVECYGVYTCTYSEVRVLISFLWISSDGLSNNLQSGSIRARSTSTRLWIIVVGGGAGSGGTSNVELAAICCRKYWIIL